MGQGDVLDFLEDNYPTWFGSTLIALKLKAEPKTIVRLCGRLKKYNEVQHKKSTIDPRKFLYRHKKTSKQT